jgi:amino acid adenylation domain-containing protein
MGRQPTSVEEIQAWLRLRISNLSNVDPAQIQAHEPLASYGLGSLHAVSLSGDLEEWLGRSFSPTLAYEYPTLAALSDFLFQSGQAEESPVGNLRDSMESAGTGPIAIVGISCRVPGASSPDDFWKLLCGGKDAITQTPPGRWDADRLYDPEPSTPGKMNTRWGGFIDNIDEFDAQFFGISPREAIRMDPQQRLLLELTWEALEDAGIPAESIAGTSAGVFIGISTNDYAHRQLGDLRSVDAYTGTGNALSIAANRISYFLDLHGPSMAVDTACSSSLVAVHLACCSIWSGESAMALAGGVNLILSPAITVNFTKAGVSAPDGRCKTFDAAADGYVRGEGAALVVLKPLPAALKAGDRIYAVIRGSATGQDGKTNGLMSPNPKGQESVLREAYRRAGLSPGKVDYIEAHGTGTTLGDQIETRALGSVLSTGREPGHACVIGSVKTNIGHLEAAAGIAGLIKVALSLKHRSIPPTLHFNTPNPSIPFESLSLSVPQVVTRLPGDSVPALAGVSSFGFGGTNAHVVLEEMPTDSTSDKPQRNFPHVFPISARSPEALNALARAYIGYLQLPESEIPPQHDILHTSAVRRTHHDYRLACVAESREELIRGLEAFVSSEDLPGVFAGRRLPAQGPKLAFVFSGQGSQWLGMARELMEEEVFKASIEQCDDAIRTFAGWSVKAELLATEAQSQLDQIDVLQPVLFAVQVALSELWQSWGVTPDAVVGHSMGEVAAAHVAGVLGLQDAVRVICARSRLLKRVRGKGGMLAVELPADEVRRRVPQDAVRVAIAADNSPTSTVLAADTAAVVEVMEALEKQDVFCRLVSVDVAAHSPQMDVLADDLRREVADIAPRTASIPFYSTVIGGMQQDPDLDSSYWARNLRQPVLFRQATQQLLKDEYDVFIEISPHSILTAPVQQTIDASGRLGIVVPSLRRGEGASRTMMASLARLYALGLSLNWKAIAPQGRVASLPFYPWQRQRYWLEADAQPPSRGIVPDSLLGSGFRSATGHHFWEFELNGRMEFLADHRVNGTIVMPAAAYIEIALAAIEEVFGPGTRSLKRVEFRQVLTLPENGSVRLQVILSSTEPNDAGVEIYAAATDQSDAWALHATAQTGPLQPVSNELPDLEAIQSSCTEVSAANYYERLSERGLEYGPRFRLIERIWQSEGEALAKVAASDDPGFKNRNFLFHPALLDACLQATGAALTHQAESRGLVLPVRIRSMSLYRRPSDGVFAYARSKRRVNGTHGFEAEIAVLDEGGELIAEVQGLELRIAGAQQERLPADPAEWMYAVEWRRADRPAVQAQRGSRHWLILSDGGPLAEELRSSLCASGDTCTAVLASRQGSKVEEGAYYLDPSDPSAFRRLLKEAFESESPVVCGGIIHLWSLTETAADPLAAQSRICASTLHFVQALASAQRRQLPRLWLVTRGAQRVGEADFMEVAQSPLWGLGKVIVQEHPEFQCTNIDLDPEAHAAGAEELHQELLSNSDDRYVALRRNVRYIPWLCRARTSASGSPLSLQGPYRLESPPTGVLDDLVIRPAMRPIPRSGEIVIKVAAAGLNFLDVLKALAIAPEVTGLDSSVGAECAGIVVTIGEDVEDFSIGDEVIAIAPSSFATYAVTQASLAVRKPSRLTLEEAATIPIAFVTAYYALHHAGRLTKGERVLIHAAAGGVGLAAIQVARWAGAEIFATAGSPEKREFLRSLGIGSVLDSRTLAFADELTEVTGGTGVDVVLNSLAGEAIAKGLSVLSSHGRFLEIGKRDIYEDARLGLLAFKRNLSFHAIDIARMCIERPSFVGQLLREVVGLVDSGVFHPLPMQLFPISDPTRAFRHMQQAKHIGKIVFITPPKADTALFSENATYLITGGLGGLGLLVAEWIVRQGARHVGLVSRRAPSREVMDKLERMRESGATIAVITADVADREEVAAFVDEMRRTMPPLKGIVHAAGILDDGLLLQLTEKRFQAVAAPKIGGAWNLHLCTQDLPLQFFIFFSSAASVLGSPGQGNYAAANAFLDALAHYRRSRGLTATSVNWGPWSEVGLAAGADRGGRLALQGFDSIAPEQGLAVLRGLVEDPPTQIAVMPIDRRRWPDLDHDISLSELLTRVLPAGPSSEIGSRPDKKRGRPARRLIRETVWKAEPSERSQILEAYLCEQVARVLGLPAPKVDVHQPLNSLGVDSLMGVELKNRIESELGVALPIRVYLQGPTILRLAAEIADHPPADSEAEAARAEATAMPSIRVDAAGRHEAFGLNEIQQAYWLGRGGFFEMGNVAAHVYGEVEGTELEVGRLSGAWQRLIERHEMLRAVVSAEGQQRILEKVPRYEIEVEDVAGATEGEEEEKLERTRTRMSHQVRPAEQWPLFELRASRRSGGRTRLHISLDLLIADAWSILLLMREWEQIYRNPEVELPRLELSFRDYVLAEAELEGSELRKQSAGYWQKRIETLAGAPELPLAKSPAAIERPRFVRRSGQVKPEQWRQLKKQAQQAGVTPSMLLCTAFAEVLGSWSKTQRFTINVTMFNRLPLHEQVNQIVGDFTTVNLLEVERRAGSFHSQAERLQQQLWEDLEHRYWSGLQVMRDLNRARGGGAMAAMPVVFTSALAQTGGMGTESVVGWLGHLVYGISQTPQVWLDHQIYEDGGALIYNWDAVEELFPEGLLDAMFGAYGDLLERLTRSETANGKGWQNVSRILIPAGQLTQRDAVNATGVEIADRRLEELFGEQAKKRAEAEAVIAGEVRFRYGELQQQARQIGRWLRERGARPNRLVGVVMEKGWEQVVAVLGVLESGAAYLPVDAAVPAERLQYLLGHGEVELVLTQSWLEGKLAWPEAIQRLAVDRQSAETCEPEAETERRSPTDLAYVIYTSGSTGQPKGVMIDHRGAVNTILEMNRRFNVGEQDRVLAVSSLNFDLSVYDIFGILAAGGTIVMPEAAAGPDPAHWAEQMSRHGVTLWNTVPALMEVLVEYGEAHPEKMRMPAFRQVWMSGDWIPLGLPDRIRKLWNAVEVVSLGGATEASIWSIYYRIQDVDPAWRSIPYGQPLANQQWQVLNAMQEPCPVWVTGQLYIGGQGLAQGYWRDQEKTQASFIRDRQTGERLYRTGDLGRYLPDGNIEFLGREDFQVKVQGHRIELGEIESALEQHPEVRTAVVTAVGEARGAKRLVAYIVPSAAATPEASALRRYLEDKLPDYMIPPTFVTLSALPLTPNGKVDRRALPGPESRSESRSFTAPRNPMERRIAKIWEEVLGIHAIGVTDDFFEIGGNSLMAVRLAIRLQMEFRRELPMEAVFRATTVERLSLLFSDVGNDTGCAALVAIRPEGSRRPVFCVHPIGGSVMCYAELARCLGDDQPFYGLQAIARESSLESMAARYVEELFRVQPQGPYVLSGASMGGIVAYEMAQQLSRRGEDIALLALFDASPEWDRMDLPPESDETRMLWRFAAELGSILAKPVSTVQPRSLDELSEVFHHEISPSQVMKLFDTFVANMRALRNYTPDKYADRVALFRVQNCNIDDDDPSLGWMGLAEGGVDVHFVQGDHSSMLRRPHVEFLAERLKSCLDQAPAMQSERR